MTDQQTPPDWVLIEAAKRGVWCVAASIVQKRDMYHKEPLYRALCDMIQKYEKPPVDRKVLCAREAVNSEGYVPEGSVVRAAIRAIDLYLEGFGE